MWTSELARKRLLWAYVSRCWKPEGEWLKAVENIMSWAAVTVRKWMKTELGNHFSNLPSWSHIYYFESLNAVTLFLHERYY